jgi:hypothetical protein
MFSHLHDEAAENKPRPTIKYEDIGGLLANLNFGTVKKKPKVQRTAPVGPSIAEPRSPTYREISEFVPGQAIRSKEFFYSQWHGRPFHIIIQDSPEMFAVHNYYASEHFTFSDLERLYKPTPNALIIIHDHDVHSYCSPLSKCKEIPWKP